MRKEKIENARRPAPLSPPRRVDEVSVVRVAEDVLVVDAREREVIGCPAGHQQLDGRGDGVLP
jgi:hypothetical protein